MQLTKLFLLMFFLLFSCAQRPAKIINRNKNNYSKSYNKNPRISDRSKTKQIEVDNLDNINYQRPENFSETKTFSGLKKKKFEQKNIETTEFDLSEDYKGIKQDQPVEEIKQQEKPKEEKPKEQDSKEKESKDEIMVIKEEEKPKEKDVKKLDENQIEIVEGDTLYGISKRFKVPMRDVIEQNSLSAPYILKIGSILNIPSPSYYEVKSGDTLYSISRSTNMKISTLVEFNKLQQPYTVKVGQKIRITKFANDEKVDEPKPSEVKKTEAVYNLKSTNKDKKINQTKDALDIVNNGKSKGFDWPIKGQIVSKFGPKNGGLYNDGINIKAKEGSPVRSSEDGVVAYVGNELKGYGNLVIIKHAQGWITAYAHLSDAIVSRGQKVVKGQKIGSVGATGNVSYPQLYFGLRKGRDAVNPQNHLK